jgi:hypothetical protein
MVSATFRDRVIQKPQTSLFQQAWLLRRDPFRVPTQSYVRNVHSLSAERERQVQIMLGPP